jgi:hypothetical protein
MGLNEMIFTKKRRGRNSYRIKRFTKKGRDAIATVLTIRKKGRGTRATVLTIHKKRGGVIGEP